MGPHECYRSSLARAGPIHFLQDEYHSRPRPSHVIKPFILADYGSHNENDQSMESREAWLRNSFEFAYVTQFLTFFHTGFGLDTFSYHVLRASVAVTTYGCIGFGGTAALGA